MKTIGRDFSTHRMLEEYYERYYKPAMAEGQRLSAEGYASSRSLSAYLERASSLWPQVAVLDMKDDAPPVVARGAKINVEARVNLAGLSPEEVSVECYRGPLSSKGEIEGSERIEMSAASSEGQVWTYQAVANGRLTGQIGYSIRILPKHEALGGRFVPGLVRWA
jgi:starch phosphorylase